MASRFFLSACDPNDARVQALRAALASDPRVQLDTSPASGGDARFKDWYERGLADALQGCAVFVAVETEGWDSSTWMASELSAALGEASRSGLPRLSLWRCTPRRLPAGFERELESVRVLQEKYDAAAVAATVLAQTFDPSGAVRRVEEASFIERVRVLREACALGQAPEELIPRFSEAWSVPTADVEFWLSALGSYELRKRLGGAGMKISYDEDHEQVFAALDVVYGVKPRGFLRRLGRLFGA